MTAFKNFLIYLTWNKDLRNNSWLTVILFNDDATTKFERRRPDKSLISLINVTPTGGTNFSAPLIAAYDITLKHFKEFDKIIYYFMSDGDASIPTNTISKIVNDKNIIEKI